MQNLSLSNYYFKTTANTKTFYNSDIFLKSKKFTLNSPLQLNTSNLSSDLFKPVEPLQRKDIKKYFFVYSKSEGRKDFLFKNFGPKNLNIDNLKKLVLLSTKFNTNFTTTHFKNLVNTNFLRKERIYTKLKYSRTPGYDIVSGGAAVILAGFLGFLVSEKYGIELPDSGDFYYLWMYGVFIAFSVRPLLTFASKTQSITSLFSLRHILVFYSNLLNLLIKLFKNKIN